MTKASTFDMTRGNILKKMLLISGPIVGSQIVQMTYNLTDMFWLGRVGSDAVAASGTVGMYLWLSMAFMALGSKGAEIGVSQSMGRNQPKRACEYGQASLVIALISGLAFAAVLVVFRRPLIGFFNIQEEAVVRGAQAYQLLCAIGVPFIFVAATGTAVFNASGNSRIPFHINIIALGINMVLDPVLIFGFGMGVQGAAIATSFAQIVNCVLVLVALKKYQHLPFVKEPLFVKPKKAQLAQILRWATPMAVESFLFTFLGMFISRMVSSYGVDAIAAQRVASQAESLSWLIAGGYSIALTSFVGQNFGAGKWGRIRSSFKISSGVMAAYGVVISLLLFFGGRAVFSVFLPGEEQTMRIGSEYLRILAMCQLFACFEAVAAGMFKGMGKTTQPAIVSVCCNLTRVVAAFLLSQTALGLNGIWWAVSIGAGVRGLWMFFWYLFRAKKLPRVDEPIPLDS